MAEQRISVRKGNYTSAVLDMEDLKAQINNAALGKPYYFSVNMQGGSPSKIFYTVVKKGTVDNTYVAEFFKDQTTYCSNGMDGMYQEDYLIKAFASRGTSEEDMTNPEITDFSDSSVKTDLLKYVEIFIDAVQVMAVMPY